MKGPFQVLFHAVLDMYMICKCCNDWRWKRLVWVHYNFMFYWKIENVPSFYIINKFKLLFLNLNVECFTFISTQGYYDFYLKVYLGLLIIPRVKTKPGEAAFSFCTPHSIHITLISFKSKLRTVLFATVWVCLLFILYISHCNNLQLTL